MHVKNYVVIMSGAAARTLKKSKKKNRKIYEKRKYSVWIRIIQKKRWYTSNNDHGINNDSAI